MDTGGTRIGRVAGMRPGTLATMASALLMAMTLMPGTASPAAALAAAPAADAIERPLVDGATDPLRGRAIALGRDGNCLLCHGLVDAGRPTGNLAPPLDGVAARLGAGQIRQRVVNPALTNPNTIMPSYYRTEGLVEVSAAFRGKPIMNAQQIEDLIAYLVTLK
jgi:sulfur-oxidizing protein SoxX